MDSLIYVSLYVSNLESRISLVLISKFSGLSKTSSSKTSGLTSKPNLDLRSLEKKLFATHKTSVYILSIAYVIIKSVNNVDKPRFSYFLSVHENCITRCFLPVFIPVFESKLIYDTISLYSESFSVAKIANVPAESCDTS